MPAPEATGSALDREVAPQDELSATAAPPDPMDKWQKKIEKEQEKKEKRITPADRQAAAASNAAKASTLQRWPRRRRSGRVTRPATSATRTTPIARCLNLTDGHDHGTNTAPASAKAIMIGPLGEILAIVVTASGQRVFAGLPIRRLPSHPTLGPTTPPWRNRGHPTTGEVMSINVTVPVLATRSKPTRASASSSTRCRPGPTGANNNDQESVNAGTQGQYVSVATPDVVTYPGSDYYEIAVVEYRRRCIRIYRHHAARLRAAQYGHRGCL